MPGRYVNHAEDLRSGDILTLQADRGDYVAGELFEFDCVLHNNMISVTSMRTKRTCRHYTSRYREGGRRYGPIPIKARHCIFDD